MHANSAEKKKLLKEKMYMLKLLQYLSGKMIVYLGEKMFLKHFGSIPMIHKNYLLQVEIEKLYEESKVLNKSFKHDKLCQIPPLSVGSSVSSINVDDDLSNV